MPWTPWPVTTTQSNKGLVPAEAFPPVIAPDPSDVPDCFVMEGWIGQAVRTNVFRIYVNPAMSEYFEVADADIIYAEVVTTVANRKRVWVKRGADMRHVVQRLQRAEVTYLAGDVAEQTQWPEHPKGEWGPEPTKCAGCYGSH
jgi:hypothetical protein